MRHELSANLILCLLTAGVSLAAFRDPKLMDRLMFRPHLILAGKEWHRLFSSAFIHLDAFHLLFNLVSLLSFGEIIESRYGWPIFLLIYFLSELGASLLSLYLHRHHDYASLGASGAVCGVMFASIFFFPHMRVGSMFLPIGLPGPLFAAIYLVVTFIALRPGRDNIGHDAHFGGAITGLLVALIIAPSRFKASPGTFLLLFGFAVIALLALARDPMNLWRSLLWSGGSEAKPERHLEYEYNRRRNQRKAEIDRILDKISRRGFDSLSEKEKALLRESSGRA